MKTDYSYLLKDYPETISMDQLYRICHISKRKAKWLLEHGVIPCKDNGNKTWRFSINLADVIIFLSNLEQGKVKNMPPPGTFPSQRPKKQISYENISATVFSSLLKKLWKQQPDVFIPEQIGQLLGYTKPSIHKWIREGRLDAVPYNSTYLIPKDNLIKYLAATVNENRSVKSAKHMALIIQCQKQK